MKEQFHNEIDEMAKDIPYLTLYRTVFVNATETKNVSWMLSEEDNKVIAESLVVKGYRNVKDKVVLSKEEWARLQGKTWANFFKDAEISQLKEELAQARKETAKRDFNAFRQLCDKFFNGDLKTCEFMAEFYKLAKQFGVEE